MCVFFSVPLLPILNLLFSEGTIQSERVHPYTNMLLIQISVDSYRTSSPVEQEGNKRYCRTAGMRNQSVVVYFRRSF